MIQSILFDRRYYTPKTSVNWLLSHGHKAYKLDITPHYIRARQFDPKLYHNYRTINLGKNIKAIVSI